MPAQSRPPDGTPAESGMEAARRRIAALHLEDPAHPAVVAAKRANAGAIVELRGKRRRRVLP